MAAESLFPKRDTSGFAARTAVEIRTFPADSNPLPAVTLSPAAVRRPNAPSGHPADIACREIQLRAVMSRIAAITSATCPGTRTRRHARNSVPSAANRKVERSMPM